MTWPGLGARSGEVKVDPDELDAAADVLAAELDGLMGGVGAPSDLRDRSGLPADSYMFGRWRTAVAMETGYTAAHTHVLQCYTRLVIELDAAIVALRSAATEIREADQASGAALNAQTAAMDATGGGSVVVA